MVIMHPVLFPRIAPMLCEEITSGELFSSAPSTLRPSTAFGLASLFTRRTLVEPTSTLSAPVPTESQGAVTLLDVIGSFDQCVERLRPALVFGLIISVVALVVRARLAAAVWALYRQRSAMLEAASAGYGPIGWSKADESAISDVGSDVETDGMVTPLARSESKGAQWLAVPTVHRQRV